MFKRNDSKRIEFIRLAAVILGCCLLLAGCGNLQSGGGSDTEQVQVIDNPEPAEFLDDEDADIFYYGDIVYTNAIDVDWVQDYVVKEQAGVIMTQSEQAEDFEDWTANKLPVGTEIYRTDKGHVFVAIVDGGEIPYLGMIEG